MTPEEIAAIVEQHRYPTLHAGDTGINVITLQIWLGMLGFYPGPITGLLDAATAQAVAAFRADRGARGTPLAAPPDAVLARDTWEAMDSILQQRLPPDPDTLDTLPFPRRSSYDSEAKYYKALYEGLRAFGFPVKPAQKPLRIPLVINDDGVAILHGVPPGSYALELGDAAPSGTGNAELHLDNADGTAFSGQIRLVRDGAAQPATVVGGHVLMNGLDPGDYQVVVDRVDGANQIIDHTGSLEIRIFDADDQPLGGTATLVGETGDLASLQQAVRLFQALVRDLTRGLDPGDKTTLDRILTSEFAETAHQYNEPAWDDFERTWGRFYGAPWMGIVFHPLDGRPEALNWGERTNLAMLHEWGAAYLQASRDENDLEERLRRPVAVRYIARPLGGRVDGRADFSQVGTDASLHLPRTSSKVEAGLDTGQTYGEIDYDSPEYSSTHLETQLAAFAVVATDFGALCAEATLVDRLLPKALQPFQTTVMSDGFARNRSINSYVKQLSEAQRSVPRPGREILLKTLSRYLPEDKMTWVRECDTKVYRTDEIVRLLDEVFHDSDSASQVALRHIKSVQKALWLCRLLQRTNLPDRAAALSDGLVARGYGGLFKNHGAIDETEFADAFDWQNPWHLEALVEFYVNYDDPWIPITSEGSRRIYKPGHNRPRLPGEPLYLQVGAKLGTGLHFVLVDPYAPRLHGNDSVVDSDGTRVRLIGIDPAAEFERVNSLVDTIHFPGASGRRTYRIIATAPAGGIVTLDVPAGETLAGVTGSWQIPAGVGGPSFPASPYVMSKAVLGYDHYDGVLFVVKDGKVHQGFHFNSYTSRNNGSGLSTLSIRGNQSYRFASARAGGDDPGTWGKAYHALKRFLGGSAVSYVTAFINYAFHIRTPHLRDAARYYFRAAVADNPGSGKTPAGIWDLFIHVGHRKGVSTGSQGCLVSPEYYDLRRKVLDLYPDLKEKFQALYDADHKASNDLRDHHRFANWNDKIKGTLWVIRPGERPLA